LITLYISAALSHLIPTENIKFPFRGDAALIFIKFNIKGRHPSIRKSIAETGAHFFWANTFGNLSYYFAAHLTFGCRGGSSIFDCVIETNLATLAVFSLASEWENWRVPLIGN